jgi:hypothetical protein
VQRDAEPFRHPRAIPGVAVEQLDDARGLAEPSYAVVEPGHVDRVEQPDLAVVHDCVGRAFEELRLVALPAEAPLELVDHAHEGRLA